MKENYCFLHPKTGVFLEPELPHWHGAAMNIMETPDYFHTIEGNYIKAYCTFINLNSLGNHCLDLSVT